MSRSGTGTVRHARFSDLPSLLSLEKSCWKYHLRASEDTLVDRLNRYPEGQFVAVIEGNIIGALYTQRTTSVSTSVSTGKHALQHPLLDSVGPFLRDGVSLAAHFCSYSLKPGHKQNNKTQGSQGKPCKDVHRENEKYIFFARVSTYSCISLTFLILRMLEANILLISTFS